jgi:hypothetical protein
LDIFHDFSGGVLEWAREHKYVLKMREINMKSKINAGSRSPSWKLREIQTIEGKAKNPVITHSEFEKATGFWRYRVMSLRLKRK